jgi:hypothetical protein
MRKDEKLTIWAPLKTACNFKTQEARSRAPSPYINLLLLRGRCSFARIYATPYKGAAHRSLCSSTYIFCGQTVPTLVVPWTVLKLKLVCDPVPWYVSVC